MVKKTGSFKTKQTTDFSIMLTPAAVPLDKKILMRN
jgi:hypothetical protein